MRKVVFDICDTLYFSNTTYDFIHFVLVQEKKKWRLFLYTLISSSVSPFFYLGLIINKSFKVDIHKFFVVKLLKGYSRIFLAKTATDFVNNFLNKKKIEPVFIYLDEYKKDKDTEVILLSASIFEVVKAIANKHNIQNFKSSTLSYKNDICTGKLFFDMTGKKQNYVTNITTVISDNKSDKNLMLLAKERLAVVYNKSDIDYWKETTTNYIKLF